MRQVFQNPHGITAPRRANFPAQTQPFVFFLSHTLQTGRILRAPKKEDDVPATNTSVKPQGGGVAKKSKTNKARQ